MRDEIKALEQQSRLLEPNLIEREKLLAHVMTYSQQYLQGIVDAPAYTAPVNSAAFGQAATITENGISIDQVLKLLEDYVDTVSLNTVSGRHLGYIPGGGLFYSALGDYLAAVANRFAALYFISPGAVQIENR